MNRHLRACLSEHLGRDARGLDFVLHAGSRGERGCVLMFVYDTRGPVAVVKYARSSDDAIKAETDGLLAIGELVRDSPLESTVEQLIAAVSLPDGRLVALKRPAVGVPALQFIGANTQRACRIVHDAVTWLIELRRVSEDQQATDPATKLALGSRIDPGAAQRPWWVRFAEHPGFAVGPAHGDFLLTNLLVDDGRLTSVIDFESYRADGLPFTDLVGLLVATGTTFMGHTEAAIESILLSDSWIHRLARQEFARYGDASGLGIDDIVSALPVYSDRSLEIAQRWGLTVQTDFHRRLRAFLIRRDDEIRRHWR